MVKAVRVKYGIGEGRKAKNMKDGKKIRFQRNCVYIKHVRVKYEIKGEK